MTRFSDDDLWEEHGEWAAKPAPFPQKQGEGPLFEADHRKAVLDWVKQQDWYKRVMDKGINKDQFGKTP